MNETTTEEKKYSNLKVERKPGSEIELTGEVPVEVAHKYRIKALRNIMRELELPGFRKGHVPEDMAMKHIGELPLMQETAEHALSAAYAQIVTDEKLDVVGRPNVTITKLAPGNPIGFKITSAVYPEVALPAYKPLAEAECKKADDPEKIEITESEIGEELKRLQTMMTPRETKDEKEDIKDKKAEIATDAGGIAVAETPEKPSAPEIDDAFAHMLGDFADLADLKDKIRKGMLIDKKQKAHDKRRLAILDAILAKTKVEVPAIFVEGELDQMLASFEERVERAGMQMADYLKQVNKTVEDMRKEWGPDAEKRAKLQLVLGEIAKKEEIKPDPAKLDREVAHIKEHYPDADTAAIRAYTTSQMTNNLVFAYLEGRKVEDVEGGHDHEHTH